MASVTSRRVVWADALRIWAILCVVMIHTSSPLFTTQPVGSAGFTAGYLLDCLVQVGVPLFVMLSGVFLLDERRPVTIRRAVVHYALPMVGLYFLWSLLYALANKVAEPVLLGGATPDGAMVREFLAACVEGAFHLWYLPMTVGLYLLTPLLRTFLRRDNPRPALYFLLVALVLRFLLPAAVGLLEEFAGWSLGATVEKFYLEIPLYPAYYVAGWLMAGQRPPTGVRLAVYSGGLVGLAAMMGLTGWASARHGEAVRLWMEPYSLFCALYTVAVFGLFCWELGARTPCPAVERAVSRLSRLTFGVYLVHVEVQALYKVFLPYGGDQPVGYMLLQWAVVSAVSFLAAWVLTRIPGVRRAVRG